LRGVAVVALHGCGGPFATRDGSWTVALALAGHIVLLPDSFGSRGLGSRCRNVDRTIKPSGARRHGAITAAEWLTRQPETRVGGVDLIGWSNGGGTVLFTAAYRRDLPPGLFRRFVAFYPGCKIESQDSGWRPSGPLMILVGANDAWTPAAPCRALAARFPQRIELHVHAGAWHDFDAPDRPMRALTGLATPPSGTGVAHTGTNQAARVDALGRVPAFLDGGR
jgi:dienelactone hydrolase